MSKIYNDAADKNVATTVIYENDGAYYYDPEHEKQITSVDEMKNLFLKGVVLYDPEAEMYKSAILYRDGAITWGGGSHQ